jgi:thymidylate kinase
MLFGTVVVCDRYATDAVVELRSGLHESDRMARRLVGLIETLAPKPRLAYLLDIDPLEANARSADGADADAASLRRAAYRTAAQRRGLRVRDASGAFERENDHIVLEVLRAYFAESSTWLNGLLLSNPRQLNEIDDLFAPAQEGRP